MNAPPGPRGHAGPRLAEAAGDGATQGRALRRHGRADRSRGRGRAPAAGAGGIALRRAWHERGLYLFVLPSLLMVAVFAYFPVASALYHAFFEWQGGEVKRFVGVENFARIGGDPVLGRAFGTIGILVAANAVKMAPAVLLAVLIHRLRSERWQYLYRVGVVLPMVVPGLVTLFVWKFFFDPNIGALNAFLDATGLKRALVWAGRLFGSGAFRADQPIGWLTQPELVVPSLILWGFPWIGAAGVLIYLAGLQNIGREVYEAAALDGARGARLLWHVELPLIATQVRMMLVLMVIHTLQGFGLQLLLFGENGGPGGRAMVPGLWMYNRAFLAGEFGYACALALVLFGAILALTAVNHRFVRVEK